MVLACLFMEIPNTTLLDYPPSVRPEPVEGSAMVRQVHHERGDFFQI
jgi:hypothetical protein